MNNGKLVLVSGRSPALVQITAVLMLTAGVEVVVGSSDFDGLTRDIAEKTPAAVLIWDAEDFDKCMNFIGNWRFSEYKPLFVVTVSDRRVYNAFTEKLPVYCFANVTVLLEPVSPKDIYGAIEYVSQY